MTMSSTPGPNGKNPTTKIKAYKNITEKLNYMSEELNMIFSL